jgi:hypothetical protein
VTTETTNPLELDGVLEIASLKHIPEENKIVADYFWVDMENTKAMSKGIFTKEYRTPLKAGQIEIRNVSDMVVENIDETNKLYPIISIEETPQELKLNLGYGAGIKLISNRPLVTLYKRSDLKGYRWTKTFLTGESSKDEYFDVQDN